MAQTQGTTTTYFALDVAIGLSEVIASQVTTTSDSNAYLHLPGVIMTENATGDVRYLLSDGASKDVGSIRHAVDETATIITYKDFDPYGNPLPTAYSLLLTPYGFTGEWWEDDVGLLYLRARWYQPETGTFLSRDAVESEPPYQYVRGNVVNWTDPSGMCPAGSCGPDITDWFLQEIAAHVSYGQSVNAQLGILYGAANQFNTAGLHNFPGSAMASGWSHIKTTINNKMQDSVFGHIIREFPSPPSASGLSDAIDRLALLEYGMYGLAIDYSDFKFLAQQRIGKGSCGPDNQFCRLGRTGQGEHRSVTLCGKCIDQTDLGNIMFGVGGWARGYDYLRTFVYGQGFNGLNNIKVLQNPFNEDPHGSKAGWYLASLGAYRNQAAACQVLDWFEANTIFGIHEDAENAAQCTACTTDVVVPNLGHKDPSSLNRVSGNLPNALGWARSLYVPNLLGFGD